MHAFWNVTDPMMQQLQTIMFTKNMAILGGALLIIANGVGAFTLDGWLQKSRKANQVAAAFS
jgi:putative oxidoreductase